MPPEPILSASVPRYKRHCCSFNSFRKISYWCWVVIPSLYHISPPFGSYLRMSPKVGMDAKLPSVAEGLYLLWLSCSVLDLAIVHFSFPRRYLPVRPELDAV